jgi:hypothetical protein
MLGMVSPLQILHRTRALLGTARREGDATKLPRLATTPSNRPVVVTAASRRQAAFRLSPDVTDEGDEALAAPTAWKIPQNSMS